MYIEKSKDNCEEEKMIEEWNVCPGKPTNFKVTLCDKGLWRLEEPMIPGKWICNFIQVRLYAPTYADRKNFLTGLFEAEQRNDDFVFIKSGTKRTPQTFIEFHKTQCILDIICERIKADLEDGKEIYIK